jgi:hypothetical protein
MKASLLPVSSVWLASCALLLAGCCDVEPLRASAFEASPETIDCAGESPDPALDEPLNELLDARAKGGLYAVDDARVIAAIEAQTERRSATAVPLIEALVFDPVDDVRIHALFALERLDAKQALKSIGECALLAGFHEAREQAYATFSVLSGKRVNYLDEFALREAMASL